MDAKFIAVLGENPGETDVVVNPKCISHVFILRASVDSDTGKKKDMSVDIRLRDDQQILLFGRQAQQFIDKFRPLWRVVR